MYHAIIEQIIIKKCVLNDYPKTGVVFLAVDALFQDPYSRKLISKAVLAATSHIAFDSVAGIASRGYLFSGMIANQAGDKGEQLIQKVKSRGDAHFVQLNTNTEYSSDALQILKDTVEPGKKYLLTDDLIATGGSIKTAIQLIRSCGGVVDTVFVMTELLDFNARAMLKEEGVELVSLLQFSCDDLQKLLLIQADYDANKPTRITYPLSQHAQALNVHLASTSLVKKEAAQSACQKLFDPLVIDLMAHECVSGVSKQPSGYEETRLGAMNRLEAIRAREMDSSIAVSMENGLRYSENDRCYYDFVHVIVKNGDKIFHHTQDCCKVPDDIIDQIDQKNQETWGEAAQRLGVARLAEDPHREALFGGVSRSEHLSLALSNTLSAVKSDLMKGNQEPMDEVSAWVTLKEASSQSKFSKRNLFFKTAEQVSSIRPIDLYNQGCPLQHWNPERVIKTEFKIFSTGDAFSILPSDLKIHTSPITIHVGLEHARYSPMVLLYEALQLCRSAHEHGAKDIRIALPKQYHPVLSSNDFNLLLLRLFKVSGANKVYFYDETYTGKLDAVKSHYQIRHDALINPVKPASDTSLDAQVSYHMRKSYLERAYTKFGVAHEELFTPAAFSPDIKAASHVLLCCSANKSLAQKIAESMRGRGETVMVYDIEGKGADAMIPEDASVCGATVTIVQSTRPNPDNIADSREYQINGDISYFFETVMIARQAHLRGAAKINLINPYQFGARSDKAENNSKGKTGAYVQHNGKLLEAAGINELFTSECHDPHTLSGAYTGKRIQSFAVPGLRVIAEKVAIDWLNNASQGQLRLVTPDAGATKRTNELAQTLQAILGKKMCESRISGEKQRSSHEDHSALINNMDLGTIGINAHDKYLITDDETATGSTLCQAITNLKKNGAEDIAVIVVHNNMPLDWMSRQLCLVRFFYLGAKSLHFSDTQEMGTLANSYDDMIQTYARQSLMSPEEVDAQAFAWFKSNFHESESEQAQQFAQFKRLFGQLNTNITVHSLADKFAHKVMPLQRKPCQELTSVERSEELSPHNSAVTIASSSDRVAPYYSGDTTLLLPQMSPKRAWHEDDEETIEQQSVPSQSL